MRRGETTEKKAEEGKKIAVEMREIPNYTESMEEEGRGGRDDEFSLLVCRACLEHC